ncbi:MAG: LysR family transcriptional regulator [Deltaproteobacteria bacterium]|nr:LysR family transcriptional regulator [Deltaproteobacteria bacterium]
MLGSVSDIDLRLLRVFLTVVRCGGFAAAQSALNVSQSQISMQMKQLEERIGTRLCHRGRGGFWLTREGRDVHDAARALFRSVDEFRSSVASTCGRLGGRLHVSVIDNSVFNEGCRLHAAIRSFKERSPVSEVGLDVVAPDEVEQMVLSGACDLGIGFFPARRQGLEYKPLFTSRMDLYCAPGNPLFATAPEGLQLDEVFSSEHAARGYVSTAQLPTFERKFLVGASSSTVEGLVTLVLSGRYTAYLPWHYARHWIDADLIRPVLPRLIGYNSLYEMAIRKESRRHMLLNLFIDLLVDLHTQIEGSDFRIGSDVPV